MATAKNIRSTQAPRRGRKRRVLFLVLIAAALALAWNWTPLTARAVAGAAYGARVACSCRYVSGRDLEACSEDFIPGMAIVMLSEDAPRQSVTGYVPLLASQTAVYRKGRGCVMESWDD